MNFISSALGAKLDFLHELVPDLALVAVLVNPRFPPSAIEVDDLQNAASAMGLQALVVNATSERDFQTAFETFVLKQANALVVGSDILRPPDPFTSCKSGALWHSHDLFTPQRPVD